MNVTCGDGRVAYGNGNLMEVANNIPDAIKAIN
jgi:hypothetical protein